MDILAECYRRYPEKKENLTNGNKKGFILKTLPGLSGSSHVMVGTLFETLHHSTLRKCH